MPRVTPAYANAQQARIRAAAATCFAERGFHATSMDEVIAAADMSSSTVYRYYPQGKNQLIDAILAERLTRLRAAIDAITGMSGVVGFGAAFRTVMLALSGGDDEGDLRQTARLAVTIWSELPRDSQAAVLMRSQLADLEGHLADLVTQLGATSSLPPGDAASAALRYTFGFLVGVAISGEVDLDAAGRQLGCLLTPALGESHDAVVGGTTRPATPSG